MSEAGSYGVTVMKDLPLNVTSPDICLSPAQYFALQQAIFNNTVFFGKVCLAVGFILGLIVMYFYMREKQKKMEQYNKDRRYLEGERDNGNI
jgi:hypothetical protein